MPVAQVALAPVAVEALVESVFGEPPPVEKAVDVMVTFQPLPEPVASFTVIGMSLGVWSVPFSVAETLGLPLVERLNVPAVTVAVAVTFAARADDATVATRAGAITRTQIAARPMS